MPWSTEDPSRHFKGLSDAEKRLWVAVANEQLANHGDEGRAIREANMVVDRYRDRKRAGRPGQRA
ncbi:MAG: hypothetical protein JOZ49_12090 [Mycolicibacterium sp.]|nr:hypothetical protein [Mycolicibacterium sp.]